MSLPVRTLSLVLMLVSAVGCGGGAAVPSGRPGSGRDITLSVRSVPGLGDVIVTHGWSLYMYPPDRQKRVTCTNADDCMTAWPPLFVGTGHRVVAGSGVHQDLIGSMPGVGGRVVTYNHWPLYFYIGDRSAGALNGQGQGFNWYVVAPDGSPIKSHFTSPSG